MFHTFHVSNRHRKCRHFQVTTVRGLSTGWTNDFDTQLPAPGSQVAYSCAAPSWRRSVPSFSASPERPLRNCHGPALVECPFKGNPKHFAVNHWLTIGWLTLPQKNTRIVRFCLIFPGSQVVNGFVSENADLVNRRTRGSKKFCRQAARTRSWKTWVQHFRRAHPSCPMGSMQLLIWESDSEQLKELVLSGTLYRFFLIAYSTYTISIYLSIYLSIYVQEMVVLSLHVSSYTGVNDNHSATWNNVFIRIDVDSQDRSGSMITKQLQNCSHVSSNNWSSIIFKRFIDHLLYSIINDKSYDRNISIL